MYESRKECGKFRWRRIPDAIKHFKNINNELIMLFDLVILLLIEIDISKVVIALVKTLTDRPGYFSFPLVLQPCLRQLQILS